MADEVYHVPALLEECIKALEIKPDGVYADATFGGGGHSRAILRALGPGGRLFGFDQDADALANRPDDARFTFVYSNFRFLRNFMRFYGIDRFDGILADLGVSFHHFDDASRGFSFREDAPLDMRMNRRAGRSAASIVADWSEEELRDMFRKFTDLRQAPAVARAIVKARGLSPITTTGDLARAVAPALNPKSEKKDLAQVFQAFRIEVNRELDALSEFLLQMPQVLKPGGRLAVLTYHSLEDRLVKNFFKTGNLAGVEHKDFYGRAQTCWKLINRSPITASPEEVERNPRSRSAKLRVAEFIGDVGISDSEGATPSLTPQNVL